MLAYLLLGLFYFGYTSLGHTAFHVVGDVADAKGFTVMRTFLVSQAVSPNALFCAGRWSFVIAT